MKAQLCSLRDSSFRWPGEETVCSEMLPALAKNIAVNFMERFFKGEGRGLVRREVERMKPQVIFCAFFYQPSLLRKKPADFWLASFCSKTRLMPSWSPSSKKL
jgi:hypothetical protein